eukprot:jgi/Orpsp1_1/1181169/evm.model.c7180000076168.1
MVVKLIKKKLLNVKEYPVLLNVKMLAEADLEFLIMMAKPLPLMVFKVIDFSQSLFLRKR